VKPNNDNGLQTRWTEGQQVTSIRIVEKSRYKKTPDCDERQAFFYGVRASGGLF